MGNYIPNRLSAGTTGAGQFTYKTNSESDLELENDLHPAEYHCETVHELAKDFMADIEADPTLEGIRAASRKYRSEAARFEEALKRGETKLDDYLSGSSSWEFVDREDATSRRYFSGGTGYIEPSEYNDERFCLTSTVLELQAVDRINEIRNLELVEKYSEYDGGFLTEPPEIEISIRDRETDFSGTVQKAYVAPEIIPKAVSSEEYQSSFAMLRAVEHVAPTVNNGRPGRWWMEVRESLKNSHQSGNGAAYLLSRYEHDPVTMEGVFSEVVIEPSIRGIERSQLEAQAISDGWL